MFVITIDETVQARVADANVQHQRDEGAARAALREIVSETPQA